jgi:hypothetical protein
MFQVEICSQQLEICKSVCMFIVLAFRLFCSDDCRSWPCDEKINNHGCWGKHAHIPDNDYWGICLFHVVWTIFFCVQCGTHGIYFYLHPTFFSSTEQYAWAIISPKESNLGSHAYHLHYCTRKQNYLLTNILRFALKICFWADF